MKKFGIITLLLCFSYIIHAGNEIKINQWLMAGPEKINMPAFSEVKDIDGNTFSESDLLKKFQVQLTDVYPKVNESFPLGLTNSIWKQINIGTDSILLASTEKNNIAILATYISVDRWTKGTINITLNGLYEFYLDDELVKSKTTSDLKSTKIVVTLANGKHKIMLKVLTSDSQLKSTCSFEYADDYNTCNATFTTDPLRTKTINDVLDGEKLNSAQISPSGKYVIIDYSEVNKGSGKSKKYSVIYDLMNKKNVSILRNKDISDVQWLPKSDKISYVTEFEGKSEIYLYDFTSGTEKSIAQNIEDLSGYTWSPAENYIIFSVYKTADKPGDLKRVYEVEDRLPYFRNRSFLFKIDVKTGTIIQLTAGNLSSDLQDIKPDGSKILFSTSRVDYIEVPFTKQNLYEMDINTFVITPIWENKLNSGNARYSPVGTKLLVQGGPDCFNKIGVNVSEGRIPNSYDGQLYIYDIANKTIDPITVNFDPSVSSAYWIIPNEIYLSVGEKDYENLYKYDIKSKKFSKIPVSVDVIYRIDFAKNQPIAVYSGTSISTPNKLFSIDLKSGISTLISYPGKERFANIQFGKNEDWNFVNKSGTTVYGRIYYPVNYDATKKYPVIVNYYGGTSPIERSFGGRYPINIWAANGYIVYVLQPSGSTGFGQDFSALHVNGWGFDAIDDIIDGTKKFLSSHSSADTANVGCIGASYGGYTTMLIQTRTDIFKTAISHAGISSITSYWGEGYWGYSYNTGAAKYSYPWNRKDIYVENSPIYNADKFKNSILLLHGAEDTNVPVGESLQYYLALKLLGKDVEMVLVDGQDHWIVDYKKRIQWHNTIMSWFDMKLKNQPQQWNELYPEKNL